MTQCDYYSSVLMRQRLYTILQKEVPKAYASKTFWFSVTDCGRDVHNVEERGGACDVLMPQAKARDTLMFRVRL